MKNTKIIRALTLLAIVFGTLTLISFKKDSNKFGGLALYTVRDNMSKDAEGTLKAVAEAGYTYIESAGYSEGKFYGMEPKAFKALLDKYKLKPVSAHQGTVTFENVDQQIKDLKEAGFEYFVIPVPPMGMFQYDREAKKLKTTATAKKMVDILTQLGKKCSEGGLKLLYHNHDFEFSKDEEGNLMMDYMIENTDPKYVNFQLDLYWVTKAGKDPVAYFEKYPGRFKIWHVKDMDDQGRFAPVTKGTIDFKRILAKKKLSGMLYYYVEQDMTFNETPLEAIKISHEGLKKLGFK